MIKLIILIKSSQVKSVFQMTMCAVTLHLTHYFLVKNPSVQQSYQLSQYFSHKTTIPVSFIGMMNCNRIVLSYRVIMFFILCTKADCSIA